MGFTTTTNYGLKKPNPFEEEDAWGPILNANFDTIDTQIKARADAIALKQDADPQLTALAGVTGAADALPYFTGATTASTTVMTAAGRALLDDADAAAQRNTLGLSTMAVQASSNVTITGGAISGITDLAVADGGTGASTLTANAVLIGNGTSPVQSVSGLGSAGQVLTSNGPAAAPTWQSGAVVIPSGTKMLFQQTAAPTGWTKDTTHNDKGLRVVNGVAGSGGTSAFSTVFASRTVSGSTSSVAAGGTVAGTAITIAQMPLHGHPYRASYANQGTAQSDASGGFMHYVNTVSNQGPFTGTPSSSPGQGIGGEGGGQTHTHGFTGSAHSHTFSSTLDMAVQYVDLIIATKD